MSVEERFLKALQKPLSARHICHTKAFSVDLNFLRKVRKQRDGNTIVTFLCMSEKDRFSKSTWTPREEQAFLIDFPSLESLHSMVINKETKFGKAFVNVISSIVQVFRFRLFYPENWTFIFCPFSDFIVIRRSPNAFLSVAPICEKETADEILRRKNLKKDQVIAFLEKFDDTVKTFFLPDWKSNEENQLIMNMLILFDAFRNRQCASCKKVREKTETFRCSVCEVVSYCNAECQLAHWKIHKSVCTKKLF